MIHDMDMDRSCQSKLDTFKNQAVKKNYQKMRFYKKLHNIIIHIHNLKTHMRNFKHLIEKIILHDNNIKC